MGVGSGHGVKGTLNERFYLGHMKGGMDMHGPRVLALDCRRVNNLDNGVRSNESGREFLWIVFKGDVMSGEPYILTNNVCCGEYALTVGQPLFWLLSMSKCLLSLLPNILTSPDMVLD